MPGMGEPDDVTSSEPHAPSCRTPLEASLLAVTAALSAEANVEALLGRVLEEARVLTRAEAGSILLIALPQRVTVSEELIGGAYQSVADAERSGGNRVAAL